MFTGCSCCLSHSFHLLSSLCRNPVVFCLVRNEKEKGKWRDELPHINWIFKSLTPKTCAIRSISSVVDLATVCGRIMGSPWKGFVEFTLPASPPAAFVSADLNSTSPVGLSLSPYGRSVSALTSVLHLTSPLPPLSTLFLSSIILISRLGGWPRSLAVNKVREEAEQEPWYAIGRLI